ncbi:DUF7373 family lipoprotein [Nocardia rhizosphaerae]|uniref:Lipoprotein n=1 Tax=Nocardia rhizosphaerae TaxID=1691571 RepID=A0ABV8L3D4_9NOCA
MATAAVLAAGCGAQVSGNAVRIEPDAAALDYGNYQTQPRTVGNAKSLTQGRAWEAQRLADHVALGFEIDPAYVYDNRKETLVSPSQIVLNRKGLGGLIINDTFDEVAEDLVAGWLNSWATGPSGGEPRRLLNLSVLIFPDAETAETVAPILENDDFTFNADNEKVSITKFPKTYAHWRPSVSSIGSWTVHDRYIIFMKIDDETRAPDLPSLTAQVERALEVQIPLLDEFVPTPSDQLERVPLDPTGLLGRTLPSDPAAPVRAQPDGYSTGRGALSLFVEPDAELLDSFTEYGVDLITFGDTVVFRSTTEAGAKNHFDAWNQPEDDTQAAESPQGLDEAVVCRANTYESSLNGEVKVADYSCYLHVDRYAVQVRNRNLQDLHQQVAAQYVLLTRR